MVTNYGGTGDLMCSSTDVKPTDVAVNTRCLELDTGKFWYFNGTTWTETPGGGGGGSATLIEKRITANGTYTASSDDADGYSSVEVDVPNTYTVDDNGKVVSNQQLVSQTAKPDTITVNDTYNTTEYNSVTVNVPNTYTVADEGKVVSQGALVSQSAYPSTIVTNGTYDTTLNNSVTVDVPTGGGGDDVKFIDYDGTVVYSYSKTDFLALTELPANPTHTGLTAQGWNWSLADAKTYVTSYDKLNIGQMYITDDGKTRLYIHLEDGRLSPKLYLVGLYGSDSPYVDVDWGDGSPIEHLGGSAGTAGINIQPSHTYATAGDYIITITVTSGTIQLGGEWTVSTQRNYMSIVSGEFTTQNNTPNFAYQNGLIKCEVGIGVTRIGNYAFYDCSSLTSVAIPNTVTSIGQYAFYQCYSLKSMIIPSGVTRINQYVFYGCASLTSVTIPITITTIDNFAFQSCTSLASVTISSGVTSIGSSAFQSCTSLASVVIPSGVTSIGSSAFRYCSSLTSVAIPNTVTSISQYAFQSCRSLKSMIIPSSVTSIDSEAFSNCTSLTSINIPSSVTSIKSSTFMTCTSLASVVIPSGVTSIENNAFNGCYSLTSVTIPSGVTSIGSSTFNTCYSLAYIDIDKPTGSISGSPWGAITSSPTSTQIIWHD